MLLESSWRYFLLSKDKGTKTVTPGHKKKGNLSLNRIDRYILYNMKYHCDSFVQPHTVEIYNLLAVYDSALSSSSEVLHFYLLKQLKSDFWKVQYIRKVSACAM